jgi:hypothetical protein
MPGHGRDNLQHELEQGAAQVCRPTPAGVTASALAMLEDVPRPAPAPRQQRWEPAYVAALQHIGLDLRIPDLIPVPVGACGPSGGRSEPVPVPATIGD